MTEAAFEVTNYFSDAFVAKVARIVETQHVTGTVKGEDDGPGWFWCRSGSTS